MFVLMVTRGFSVEERADSICCRFSSFEQVPNSPTSLPEALKYNPL